jgi:hypothetical protein
MTPYTGTSWRIVSRPRTSMMNILHRICEMLDPQHDKATLLAIQRSCTEGWRVATPLIYRRIRINRLSQWENLRPPGFQATSGERYRIDTAFSHVETVQVDCLPDSSIITLPRNYHYPDSTLFPHAVKLAISLKAFIPDQMYESVSEGLYWRDHLERVSLLLHWLSPPLSPQPIEPASAR